MGGIIWQNPLPARFGKGKSQEKSKKFRWQGLFPEDICELFPYVVHWPGSRFFQTSNVKSLFDFFRNVLALTLVAFFAFDACVLLALASPESLPAAVAPLFASLIGPESSFLLASILIAETFAYALLTWGVLVSPIRKLRKQVAYFIAGVRSGGLQPPNWYPDLWYIINFFNRSFEILWSFKDEFKAGRVLKSEVELASELQRHVLKKTDFRTGSLDIVANTKPATEVGGDSYDIIERGENRYVYLGDVTGHGVASGFVMMIVNALISAFSEVMPSGAQILSKTNEIVKPRVKSNMLMTCLMIRWNEAEKKLYMTGAGHEYLIIYKKSQNAVFKIKTGGVAIGMTKDISRVLKESQISFDPGDVLVLYTDGITEARSGNREADPMFGVERLVSVVAEASDKTARGIFNHVTMKLSQFMGYNHRQFDDITLITVHYHENRFSEAPKELPKEVVTEWNWN